MIFNEENREILETLLQWRRDVRHFRPGAIPETQVETLRRAMDYAPSVGNARPWRVIRVEDAALRQAVRENFAAANESAASIYDSDRRAAYAKLKLEGLEIAPLHLAIFTDLSPAAGHGLGRQTMQDTLIQSTAMAIHGLWLTARALNLGLGMVSILDPAEIETLLQTPPDWRFTAYLCIGHPAAHDDTPLLHRTGWQENSDTAWHTR
ncbi:5,6-dimethylbenzimidazole synthase [Paracoccaceae bacterium GXU_MW_L88]